MPTSSPFETCRVTTQGRMIVFAHSAAAPRDAEWDRIIELFGTLGDLSEARTLVYTAGGAPTVVQRGKLNDLLAGKQPRIAVLTPSRIARAAGAALRWFNPRIRVFEPDAIAAALDHLAVDAKEAAYLEETLASLRSEIGV